MARESQRDVLLQAGLRVMMATGFFGTSVREVVREAGVPQGSFSYHFRSKEDFALEVLDLYYRMVTDNVAKTLTNEALRPLERLSAWLDVQIGYLEKCDMKKGCLIGNLSLDSSGQTETLRQRLIQIYDDLRGRLAECLDAAVKSGDINPVDTTEMAAFIYATIQGSIQECKVRQSSESFYRFKRLLFSHILTVR